jgi:hypothetical protein
MQVFEVDYARKDGEQWDLSPNHAERWPHQGFRSAVR